MSNLIDNNCELIAVQFTLAILQHTVIHDRLQLKCMYPSKKHMMSKLINEGFLLHIIVFYTQLSPAIRHRPRFKSVVTQLFSRPLEDLVTRLCLAYNLQVSVHRIRIIIGYCLIIIRLLGDLLNT